MAMLDGEPAQLENAEQPHPILWQRSATQRIEDAHKQEPHASLSQMRMSLGRPELKDQLGFPHVNLHSMLVTVHLLLHPLLRMV